MGTRYQKFNCLVLNLTTYFQYIVLALRTKFNLIYKILSTFHASISSVS